MTGKQQILKAGEWGGSSPGSVRGNRSWGRAVFFGILVGIIYFLPHALFIFDCWPRYHYPFLGSPDERNYCSEIREAGEEGYRFSDPYLVEYKDEKNQTVPFSVGVVALLARVFHLPLDHVPVLLDFLAPFGLFLLLYYLLVILRCSPWLSVVGASSVLLTSLVTLGMPNMMLIAILKLVTKLGIMAAYNGFPIEEILPNTTFPFSRLINPQVNFFPFIGGLIFLALLAKEKRLFYVLGFGVSCGSLFYIAPFYWMYLLAGLGLLGLLMLITKDYGTVKFLGLAFALALFIGFPSLYSAFESFVSVEALEVRELSRFGLFNVPRTPFLSIRELVPVLLFLVLYPGKDRRYIFLASFLLGGLICENQHLVTGKQFAFFKYTLYTNGPVVWIALFALLARIAEKKNNITFVRWIAEHAKPAALVCLAGLFVNGIFTQTVFYRAEKRQPLAAYEVSSSRWKSYQDYYPGFEWLKEHGSNQDVVLASEEVSTLIPCFTQLNVLTNHFVLASSAVSYQELLERWFVKFRFFDISPEEIRGYLDEHILVVTNTPTSLYFDQTWGRSSYADRRAYEGLLERVSKDYAEFYRKKDILGSLREYHVSYIWLSQFESEEFLLTERGIDPGQSDYLTLVYQSDRVKIYRVGH